MQTRSLRSALLAMPVLFAQAAAAHADEPAPVLEPAPVEQVYVPHGFDDNDNVEVIVAGRFLGTCYKTGPISAKVDIASSTIDVKVDAFHYTDERCGKRLVWFTQAVKIGTLKAGTYQIRVNGTAIPATQPLGVTRAAHATPDDYVYAPVDSVHVDETNDESTPTLVLSGRYPHATDDCMILKEVRAVTTPDHLLVVQPIVEFATGPVCEQWRGRKSFHYVVKLPAELRNNSYLAHVRVMNGNSLNTLLSF